MLIVSEDPSIEGNEDAIVKYYSFDLDIEENIDPKEGNNKDNHANFDPKEGKKVYNKGNQDKRKSNNIGKSVAKENKISIAEESEDESEENVENDDEKEFGDNDDNEIEDNDDEIEDNDDEIGDNDDEFGDNDDEFGDNNDKFGDNDDEFGDNDDKDKEEIVNKKRKIKELQTSKKQKGLPVVAPFFDDNAQVRKSDYYRNIKKHLKTIMQQSSTSKIIQFDSSLINGALSMDLYQEEQEPAISILSEFDNSNLRDQINLLRKVPELPSNILMNTSLLTNSNNQQILMFSSLISMCYKSLHKVEISSYNSELYRRMNEVTTQINAFLTGRITLQQLLNIENTTSETFLVHQPIKQKKKKLVTLDEISINIPGFVSKVSARKLKTFTTAGPQLEELLKALNDNWVILDLVDYTTITWLANIKKDKWIELIHQITSNS
ncbi:hypothetical protein C2G38_2205083 [Gigaspora rosea]|uniref:Uncharacterized protein n=1 Tax=Gigaspora rosea TaxID=44941 RepID=A0A397UKQ0_9GLOM|nr:hypothetical protein C2G38_2205083 [Gigaspora rosea]